SRGDRWASPIEDAPSEGCGRIALAGAGFRALAHLARPVPRRRADRYAHETGKSRVVDRKAAWTAVVALLCAAAWADGLRAQAYGEGPGEPLAARIWFDRGDEPVLAPGDRVRIYYRAATDAFVAIFNIDT